MMTALSLVSLLAACPGAVTTDALFKDVQRAPPALQPQTAEFLVKEDRAVAVWIAETVRKCEKFGCVQ